MSKKKSTTTMTLKDFHGGSIPSQLSLPSAPASSTASARAPDRPGAWGTAAASGRLDHHHLLRPRPGSAGATPSASARGLDERPPAFLAHPPDIGRHFDEDERKPFDASSSPRRPDNTLLCPPAPSTRSDPKRPILSPVVPPPASLAPAFPPPSGCSGSAPNPWGLRKEVGGEPPPTLPAQPASPMWLASRLAQASAVEKVSSGRWQSKPPEVEVIRSHQSTEGLDRRFGDTVRLVVDIDRDRERERLRSVLSGVAYEEGKEMTLPGWERDEERARSPMYPEVKERNAASFHNEGARPVSSDGRISGSKLYRPGTVEIAERPRLKLLPRTKPLESPDIQTKDFDDKQVYQAPVSMVHVQENVHAMHGSAIPAKPGLAGADEGSQAVGHPKLNLKPRTEPTEQSDGITDRERKTVFGGARPRELVLKERGVDVAANDLDMTSPLNRARNDLPRTDSKAEPTPTIQPGERAGRFSVGQRTGRDPERKGHRPDTVNEDLQRDLWRNDNQRNTRENEKPLEQPHADVETWRKPVEQPKPDMPAPRFGKAASAVELAQAFSKSESDARLESRSTSQRNIPGQAQLPFSRLTDKRELYSGPAQRHINGY